MKENWQYKKLIDVCDIQYGYPFESSLFSSSSDEGMPLVRIRDVKNGYSESFYKGKYPIEYVVHRGDYLIGMDGEFNISDWKSDDALLNQRVCKISTKNSNICIKFIYRFLSKELKLIEAETPFVTVKHLSAKRINQIYINLPPIEEQERIVAELDLLSGIIEKQKQQLKELDTLAQSFFYSMFGDPVTNDKNWPIKSIGDIGEIVGGSTPSTSDESNWDGDINWVTPAELNNQLYYGETQRKITQKAANKLTLMPVGTILLSSRAPIGKLAITTVPMCCNQGFKNIICGEEINNVFMYYLLSLTIEYIKALGRGATFKEVSKQSISNHKIIVPPLELQNQFAEKIEWIEKQKERINKSIEETQKLFDYSMDKYFG